MPHGPLGDRIPFEGVLNCWNDDHDLPDLLLAISRSGKTGRVHFSNPEGDKTLDLRGGRIVFAESSSQDDGLGQYLLRTGKISLMDYIRVSKLVQPGKRLGALLVDENVLAPEDLVPAVIGQVRSVILSLFRRTETWYRFKEEELEQKEAITLDLAVPELILEGVRYVESWRRVSKGVGSLESVYQTSTAHEEELRGSQLDDGVRELVDMLATPTSLQEICTRATLPDFEACRYLWAFRSLGWIDLVDKESVATATSSIIDDAEIELPARSPADTPTLPSIERPAPKSIPQELVETQLAVDPPTTPAEAPSPERSAIPESLIRTQVSMTRPDMPEDKPTQQPKPAAPAPQPPRSPEPPRAVPDELMHTQMFVEAPPEVAPTPPSTGEVMESILDGDDSASLPQAPEAPPSATNQAATQFFEGPSALEPMDDDLAAPPPPEPTPAPPSPAQAPSGFEALALGGGPGGPPPPVSPANTVTQPSVQPPPSAQPDQGMASFSDVALPEAPVPMVEADVITAQPAPPKTPAYIPEEPLLPPSVGNVPIERESLVPPRRRAETDVRKDDNK